jgi:WD40 repeat protein/serine/threonine protein kinase
MSDSGIFKVAVKLSPERRAAYLDQACGSNYALRREVESLLQAHDEPGSFLQDRLAQQSATVDGPTSTETPGTVIGPYKLLQQIGEGGMGAVYMAEQTEPVRRRVALKIIKPGMDSRQVVARFEAERQALAMMDHQNIAKVLDAGYTGGRSQESGVRNQESGVSKPRTGQGSPTPDPCLLSPDIGRPYFVMELVHGVPITQFCDDRHLTPRERLELFVPVCRAIQHAHQKGVIHRDIKPSNVLVTMHDDKPVPKVIDFGVAKAIEQRLTERTMFTQFGALVGTFQYMSPEQAEMNAFGVDTRSDVYSLGVLLYELLTGTTPLGRERLRTAAMHELVRLIKEEEAPRPSVRLSSLDHLPSVAAARRTEPGRLPKLVRGELDWIVMKCLEKDRRRRYETASGLARDVEHYLSDEPVEACPPTAGYRLRKFARKYRTPLWVAGAFVLLLVVGAVASTWQAIRATVAEHAAESRKREANDARRQAEQRRDELARLNEDLRRTHYTEDMNLARVAWDENNLALTHELLEKHRGRPGEPDLRGFEWYYLDRLARGGQLRIDAHAGGVNSVAFMPDGRRLISSGITEALSRVSTPKGAAGAIRLWDASTGRPIPLQLEGPADKVTSVALSPDGTRLAARRTGDHSILLWDLATGGFVTLEGPADHVAYGMRFSPDGKRLVSIHRAGETHLAPRFSMRIWDASSGKLINTVDPVRATTLTQASFSPDGRLLVVCPSAPASLTVYDAETGRMEFSRENPDGRLVVAVFSPDGTRLAACGDRGIRVWDVSRPEPTAFWPSEFKLSSDLAFSRDGKHLARASWDALAEVWDTATGRKLQTFKGHSGIVNSIAFSPDGKRLATGGADGTVRLWDIAESGDAAATSLPDSGLRSVIPYLSPDGRSLLAITLGQDRQRPELWDTSTRRMRSSPIELEGVLMSVDWSGGGQRLYLADAGKNVYIVETASGQVVGRFRVSAEPSAYKTALSPDEKWYAYSGPGHTIQVWDVRAGALSRTIPGLSDDPRVLKFNPDGTRLLGADVSGNVKLWDIATGRELVATTLTGLYVNTIRFSRDGTRVALVGNRFGLLTGQTHILDAASLREVWSLRGHTSNVTDADFSPDGRRLATASADRTVRFWNLDTGQEALKLSGNPLVTTVRFVSGGRRLIGGSMDRTIRVWDATPLDE